uniref:BING4 C-terminal domain-containing protein n=1 Tax=Chaetoceros debilis TaxID=122233 RepID=A0A7S3VGC4_9STRA|mmetsp:Transcript_15608/g.23385  ORF Transcript_15608/g.23385 Transcript_15608/m.23385 type:complete len:608 (+) Transcript_15608:107-1930(+)
MSHLTAEHKQLMGEQDIGGTNLIAKGESGAESEKRRKLLKKQIAEGSQEEIERVSQYYNGGQNAKYYNSQRRQNLRMDDANPRAMEKLNSHQQRSLLKRKRFADKTVKAKISRIETKRLDAAIAAADAEIILNTEQSGFLEVDSEMERTYKLTQNQLKEHLDEQTAKHIYDLKLDQYSPYGMNYDRSGRCGLLYGKNGGHIALMDMHTMALKTEIHLNEKVRDATFLHNTSLFAVAQKKHAFIYDDSGIEIHRMSEHQDIFQMQFLPHHWLLCTIGRTGYLKYHDTSTGQMMTTHRTKMGACHTMTQNKSNAVIHCGHLNGAVTLWSPASSNFLVKMLCHRGAPVQSLAVDKTGRYMVTGGADSQVKIWDLRMYKQTHSYFTRGGSPTSLDISQKGVLGIGHGSQTTFWSPESLRTKVKDPYMGHSLNGKGPVESVRFRPFEDVCGLGHSKGISSIVIPGSGEPNLDSMEYNLNPYQDKKQRQEAEVRSLLDKLSPDMITLDPNAIGTVEEGDTHTRLERNQQMEEDANEKKLRDGEVKVKEKNRMRGRNKTGKKLARKKKNVIDANVLKLKEEKSKQKTLRETEKNEAIVSTTKKQAPSALIRFFK